MKFKRGLVVIMSIALILSGCNNQVETTEATTETGTELTTESVQTTETSEEHTIIKNEKTIKNDSKTNSIITSQESFQLGTYITLSIYADKEVPTEVFDKLFNLIDYYEYMVSKNIDDTELNQVNENAGIEPVKVDDDLFEMVKLGIDFAGYSDGLFDISIGPLVDLWGIGTDFANVPNEADIKEKMALIDYKTIVIDENEKTIFLPQKGMSLDLGAIAKGYIADRIKELILEEGYESAIINLGGNVLTVGTKPNSDTWSIGVRDPESDAGSTMGILKLEDNSIVSSGIYERFFIEGDIRYHHLINPKVGYPEQNDMMSVSIISELSVDGDALSTTVFLLGLEAGFELVEELENVEAVFVMADRSVYITSGLGDKFILTNDDYTIKELAK
jgi:thiamine biosynthesis lipoprotein